MLMNDAALLPVLPLEDARWHIELLGGLRAYPPRDALNIGGSREWADPVEQFRTHKAALLLARLALSPHRAHARDELAELLWPDAPANRGRASLTQTLVYLRTAFHQPRTGGLFITDHKTVRVTQNALQTDVARWEAAACRALDTPLNGDETPIALVKAVLTAYVGELLPGFYDGWVCDERSRLADLHDKLNDRLRLLEGALPAAVTAPAVYRDAGVANDAPFLMNAPLFLTRFFGREAECAHLRDLLLQSPPVRLVTLRGMGGIGKTRLAFETAQSVVGSDTSPFGWAAYVPLDAAQTAEQMESVLRSVLGSGADESDSIAAIAHTLNNRSKMRGDHAGRDHVLLVLDNLEQLGADAAPVVARLLILVPRLTVLATSRQPIGIAGEVEIPLGPLNGSGSETIPVDEPEDARLFVDRARLARPSFALTAENKGAVITLCNVLEGVPLALELAAAWVRVLTLPQILARLSHRFDLLALRGASAANSPLVAKRHQSLHSTIAWSYDLLGPSLQTIWAQLSVLRGGWTAEAAQAVTGLKEVSEPLLLLAERSLILVETNEATGTVRYRMLESLREFAETQAQAQGDDFYAALTVRHARYFADLSREANAMIKDGRGMRPALHLLGPERDNLHTIFSRLQEVIPQKIPPAETDVSDANLITFVQAAIENIVRSIWFWTGRERLLYLQAAADVVSLLPKETGRPLYADVLRLQGWYLSLTGDYAAAERLLRESLALWTALGNETEVVTVKNHLAAQAWKMGNSDHAFVVFMESLHFAQKNNNLRLESAMLNNLAIAGPDLAQRRAWIERAVALDNEHFRGSTFHACSVSCLGSIAFLQNDRETAQRCFEEAHAIALADGNSGMIAVAKYCLAGFVCDMDESLDRAEHLLHEAQILYESLGEYPRISDTLLLRFQVALKRGDCPVALSHARDYLRVNRDAHLMDAEEQLSAQADITKRLRDTGHKTDALLMPPSEVEPSVNELTALFRPA